MDYDDSYINPESKRQHEKFQIGMKDEECIERHDVVSEEDLIPKNEAEENEEGEKAKLFRVKSGERRDREGKFEGSLKREGGIEELEEIVDDNTITTSLKESQNQQLDSCEWDEDMSFDISHKRSEQ